jgi:hypothetical protein
MTTVVLYTGLPNSPAKTTRQFRIRFAVVRAEQSHEHSRLIITRTTNLALRTIMPHSRRLISTVLALVASISIAGCSKSAAPTSPATSTSSTGNPGSASPKGPETSLTVGFVFGETQEVPNPDPATIEKHLRAADWNNAQQRPLVHVTRKTATGSTTIKLQGTLGTPNDDGPFHATVLGLDSDEKGGLRIVLAAESKPLESVDAALELLLLLQNDPQKIRQMAAEWPNATAAK